MQLSLSQFAQILHMYPSMAADYQALLVMGPLQGYDVTGAPMTQTF